MERTICISAESTPTSCDVKLLPPFDSFPLELVCHILCFLGPRDVVQLRLVSKLFHDITYDPVIWKKIYANARLPRPPGPFPSQSIRFLEQTLVRSARLAECWTTQPIRAVSSTQIRLGGPPLGHARIIGGKWLLAFESHRQIVLYDVETHSRQVLWEATGLITSWDACSIMSASGLLVYVIFRKTIDRHAPWTLVEFREQGESSHLSYSVSLDVPMRYFWQSACLVGDRSPLLYIMGQHLVFDARSRTFYELPEFGSELIGVHAHPVFIAARKVLLTNSHIIVVSSRSEEPTFPFSTMEPTLVQAFTLPAGPLPAGNETGTLRLSHEGIIPERLGNLVLIRNSIIDPITGSTSLRFLRLQPEGDHLHFSCVDLTLPRSLPDTILTVSIEVNDIFTVENGIYDSLVLPSGYCIDASDDGHARGFCSNRAENDGLDSLWMTKFTIDATGDKCFATVGSATLPQWNRDDDLPRFSRLSFDGVVGRFCYLKGHNWRLRGFVDAVVIDIK